MTGLTGEHVMIILGLVGAVAANIISIFVGLMNVQRSMHREFLSIHGRLTAVETSISHIKGRT